MQNRKIIYSILVFLVALAMIFSVILFRNNEKELRVVFFDVGQGDSIMISQGNDQVLIDGGRDGKVLLEKIGKYVPFWDRNIETVIETHPDSDHIAGLIDLLGTYKVQTLFKTNMQSSSQTFQALEKKIAEEKINTIEAKSGESIIFPDGAEAKIIFPFDSVFGDNDKDTNSTSVVVRLSFGNNNFLFTGDLPIQQEQEIIAKNIDIKADVLKVGHHGSKYSSSDEFLQAVAPKDGIVSVGKNNSYGHPAPETLQRLRNHNINIIRTDEVGDIEYECKNLESQCLRTN
jgi:competence protein ComEC